MVKIGAVILVERESQKGIVIGKNGNVLKEVGRLAREEIENCLAARFSGIMGKGSERLAKPACPPQKLGYNLNELNE